MMSSCDKCYRDDRINSVCQDCDRKLCSRCNPLMVDICRECVMIECTKCTGKYLPNNYGVRIGEVTSFRCSECQNVACNNCLAYTEGGVVNVCKDCFDYKCLNCNEGISIDETYSTDSMHTMPYCKNCIKLSNRQYCQKSRTVYVNEQESFVYTCTNVIIKIPRKNHHYNFPECSRVHFIPKNHNEKISAMASNWLLFYQYCAGRDTGEYIDIFRCLVNYYVNIV